MSQNPSNEPTPEKSSNRLLQAFGSIAVVVAVAAIVNLKECDSSELPKNSTAEVVKGTRGKMKWSVPFYPTNESGSVLSPKILKNIPVIPKRIFETREALFAECQKIQTGDAQVYAATILDTLPKRLTEGGKINFEKAIKLGCVVSGLGIPNGSNEHGIIFVPPAPFSSCNDLKVKLSDVVYMGDENDKSFDSELNLKPNLEGGPIDEPEYSLVSGDLNDSSVLEACDKEYKKIANTKVLGALEIAGIENVDDMGDIKYVAAELGCEAESLKVAKLAYLDTEKVEYINSVQFKAPSPYDECQKLSAIMDGDISDEDIYGWTHPKDLNEMSDQTRKFKETIEAGNYKKALNYVDVETMCSEFNDSLSDLDPEKAQEMEAIFEGIFEEIDEVLKNVEDPDAVCKWIDAIQQVGGLEASDSNILSKQYMFMSFLELSEGIFGDYSHCEI